MLEVSAQEIVPGDIVVLKPEIKCLPTAESLKAIILKLTNLFSPVNGRQHQKADIVLPKDTPWLIGTIWFIWEQQLRRAKANSL